jgi:diguanylate cyclase (GGDEF)-like protein
MRILIVEDDEIVAQSLTIALNEHHYAVDVANDGRMGWDYAITCAYDVIILDVMLPILNGIHFCHQLRSSGRMTPILLVTAHGDKAKLIEGLDAGADDYVMKPFDLKEVLARLRALVRRGQSSLSPMLNWGDLKLDPNACEVKWQENLLKLTPKEYSLLALLLRNPKRIYSSSALIDHLWSLDTAPSEDTIRSHVKGLRNKLKSAQVTDDPIETVYGIGYRLRKLPDSIDVPSSATVTTIESVKTPANPQPANPQPIQPQNDAEITDRIASGLAQIWSTSQGKLFTRIENLEQAIALAHLEQITDSIAQIAEESAHKLAGSLGMFESIRGSQLAKKIEQWFIQLRQGEMTLLPLEPVTTHIQELRNCLEQMSGTPIGIETIGGELNAVAKTTNQVKDVVEPIQSTVLTVPLSERPPSEAKILILDDDKVVIQEIIQMLNPWGFEVVALPVSVDLLFALQIHQPDLLILDVQMGELSGLALCQTLRNTVQWTDLPILFLTDKWDSESTHRIFAAGADDLVRKPIIGPELVTRLLNRLERSRLLRNLSETDSLTQVANRRTFTAQADTFLRIAHRHEKPLCLAIVGLYQLPKINDRYGYLCGDEVLKRCAKILKANFRKEDLIGRWSDEKFLVVLYGTDEFSINYHFLELVMEFKRQDFVSAEGNPFTVNLAVGFADYQQGDNLQSIYDRAEQSLVESIKKHRNSVMAFSSQEVR